MDIALRLEDAGQDEATTGRSPGSRFATTLGVAACAHILAFALVPSFDFADATDSVRVLSVQVMNATRAATTAVAPPPVKPLTPMPVPARPATADTPVEPVPVVPAPTTADVPPPPAATTEPQAPATRAPIAAPVSVVAHVDTRYGDNPKPVYPAMSRRLGEEGQVLLRVRVAVDGHVVAVDIERTSGFARLDEAARRAVGGWRFVPARHGDENIESTVVVPLAFALDS